MTQCFGDFLPRDEDTLSWIKNPSASVYWFCCWTSLLVILPWWSVAVCQASGRAKKPHCGIQKKESETLYTHKAAGSRGFEQVSTWNQEKIIEQAYWAQILYWRTHYCRNTCVTYKKKLIYYVVKLDLCWKSKLKTIITGDQKKQSRAGKEREVKNLVKKKNKQTKKITSTCREKQPAKQ